MYYFIFTCKNPHESNVNWKNNNLKLLNILSFVHAHLKIVEKCLVKRSTVSVAAVCITSELKIFKADFIFSTKIAQGNKHKYLKIKYIKSIEILWHNGRSLKLIIERVY